MNTRIMLATRAAVVALMLTTFAITVAHTQDADKHRSTPPRSSEPGSPVTPQATADPAARVYPGDAAPDFELDASNGKAVRLSKLRGDWIALVFSDRMDPVTSLQPISDDLRRIGVQLATVCREKANRVRKQTARDGLTFLVLADPTGQIGALYGLRDYRRSETLPAFLLIDRKGVVRLAVLGQSLSGENIVELTRNVVIRV